MYLKPALRVLRAIGQFLAYLAVVWACMLSVVLPFWGKGLAEAFAPRWGYAALLVLVAIVGLEPVLRERQERRYVWLEMFVFLVLPWWGDVMNRATPSESCPDFDRHLLAIRELQGTFAGYGVALMAYGAARLKPEGYPALAESVVQGLLWFGIALVGMIAVHTVPFIPVGVLFFGLGIPIVAPVAIVILFAVAVRRRPRFTTDGRPSAPLAGAVAVLSGTLYAVAHAIWLKSGTGLFHVVSRTSGGIFSQLPECPALDEHYLCTVAAQGSPWLVRPLRMGRRHGRPIIVNRQLAVANAFEDLLHERWPRCARVLRRTYDRLGLPISRLIRIRVLADMTYLVMKPAEWLFLAALRVFDDDPEVRIARMYR